jgi:hypothetical protein
MKLKKLGINIQEQQKLQIRKLENERNLESHKLAILQNEFNILSQKTLNYCQNQTDHFKLP